MTDETANNPTPEVTEEAPAAPRNNLGGRPRWVPTPYKDKIIELASQGLFDKDIAVACDITHKKFCEKKHEYPEIDEWLQEGRRSGRTRMIRMSWDIVQDKKDPARNQEIARLHRLLKTEAEGIELTQIKDGSVGGFTVQILPAKAPEEEK
jgi:hypothetical protein